MTIRCHICGLLCVALITVGIISECSAQLYITTKHIPSRSDQLISPDKKYQINYIVGDASLPDKFAIYFYSKKSKKQKSLLKTKPLYKIDGFQWLPKHPHTLVFAGKWLTGDCFIALWKPKQRLRFLLKGNRPSNEDPDAEFFLLVRVSSDSHRIAYMHYQGWLNKDPTKVHFFQLPK